MNAGNDLRKAGGHQFDVGSLTAGLLFAGLGIAFVLEASGRWSFELDHFRFIGPLVLIIIGLTTLIGASLARHDQTQH